MIMTRESDYAVRILRALAGGDKMTVGRICEAELVPVQFAYKILKKLAKCGYVEIFRGAEGGCRLSADLGALTLYDLLRCIDEDLFVTPACRRITNARGAARTAASVAFTAISRGCSASSRTS